MVEVGLGLEVGLDLVVSEGGVAVDLMVFEGEDLVVGLVEFEGEDLVVGLVVFEVEVGNGGDNVRLG